jgi:hypothetical protein
MTPPQQLEADYDRPKYLGADYYLEADLLEADFRGRLLCRGRLHDGPYHIQR